MKELSHGSRQFSRRGFVATLAAAVTAAASAQAPKGTDNVQGRAIVFTEHIPPLDFEGGSFVVESLKALQRNVIPGTGRRKQRYTYPEGDFIGKLRILAADGTMLFDPPNPRGYSVRIWLHEEQTPALENADVLIEAGASRRVETEIDRRLSHTAPTTPAGKHRYTRTNTGAFPIHRVEVWEGGTLVKEVHKEAEVEISNVKVWPMTTRSK